MYNIFPVVMNFFENQQGQIESILKQMEFVDCKSNICVFRLVVARSSSKEVGIRVPDFFCSLF